jgi:hypothetical protein
MDLPKETIREIRACAINRLIKCKNYFIKKGRLDNADEITIYLKGIHNDSTEMILKFSLLAWEMMMEDENLHF